MLGVALKEQKISSLDERVADYYPEMLEVGEKQGPKAGRYATEKDGKITFRHLICNLSGYLKPEENPGDNFHYQTFGMCILQHTIARLYGCYDSRHPDKRPAYGDLVREKLEVPLDGSWSWRFKRSGPGWYPLQQGAKENIYGYYTEDLASAQDMARMGYLWLRNGKWRQKQLIPHSYLQEAVSIHPDIAASFPGPNPEFLKGPSRIYGYGVWIYTDPGHEHVAWRGVQTRILICPKLDLVVAEAGIRYSVYPAIADACLVD